MNVFHAEDLADDALAELVADEMSTVENQHLAFRGNSIATKAMEAYIKLVAGSYLRSTLQSVVNEIITSEVDLEVDPVKVTTALDAEELAKRRANLRTAVKQVWSRVAKSYSYFPPRLQRCFSKIRQFLEHVGKPDEVSDNLISSCIFLRYLCPAVLSPSLFNLTDEYPGERANRSLTLVAKALQSLANFSRYDSGKEPSLEFMNDFLEEEYASMRRFLRLVSSPLPEDVWLTSLASNEESSRKAAASTGLGRHLATLHTILLEHAPKMDSNDSRGVRLRQLLDDINALLHRPTIPQLEQISQPTMTTLRRAQQQEQPSTPPATIKSPSAFLWSWTLPKPRPRGGSVNISRPSPTTTAGATALSRPPSLQTSGILAKPETISSEENNTSSSSASLSPSPGSDKLGCFPTTGPWSRLSSNSSSALHRPPNEVHCRTTPGVMKGKFSSAVSLDDTDDSDDSTYSSQYQSDAASGGGYPSGGGHRTQTLPRPLTGGGGGYATHSRHRSVQRSGCGSGSICSGGGGGGGGRYVSTSNVSNVQNRTLGDYEREILELRSAMEALQAKLGEAEKKLEERRLRESAENVTRVAEDKVREAVNRLAAEEDKLRREQQGQAAKSSRNEKETLILMQQRKVATLEDAEGRLNEEVTRLKTDLSRGAQRDPQTVEELLDSLHSTPI